MLYLKAKNWFSGMLYEFTIEISQLTMSSFVGLTPSILVCLGISRWLSGFFGGRKGKVTGKRRGRMIRILRSVQYQLFFSFQDTNRLLICRNLDRILAASTSSNNGMLSYKEHGLLLCEIHVLRQNAHQILPNEIYREFLEEIHDLVDIRTGVQRQLRVVERIRWAYSRWLN